MSWNKISLLKNCQKYRGDKEIGWFLAIKAHLITFLSKSFRRKYSSKFNLTSQLTSEIIVNTVITFQMISIFWYHNMPIHNWNTWITPWNYLRFVNIDNFCAYFGIIDICFVGFSSIIGVCTAAFIFCGIFYWYSKKSFSFITRIAFKVAIVLSNIGFIPIQTLFWTIFKYSTFKITKVQEYTDCDYNRLDLGIHGSLLSILFSVLLFVLAIIVELFSANVSHTFLKRNIMSRANSNMDLLMVFLSEAQVICYVFLNGEDVANYQLIFCLITLILCYKWIEAVPYYNPYENIIKICRVSCIWFVLTIFLFGYIMDNAAIITVLSIVLSPLFIIIVGIRIYNNCDLLSPRKISFKSQTKFEQTVRHLLTSDSHENKILVINLFSDCYKKPMLQKNKLLVIWEVNYCLHTLKDTRLARIKLTKALFIHNCIEGEIQECKANIKLEKKSSELPDVDYLKYLADIENAKVKDEEMCNVLLNLWNEVISESPKISILTDMFIKVDIFTQSLKSLYGSLFAKNKHSEVLDLYGTFLENIMGEHEDGAMILKKKLKMSSLDSMIGYHKKLEDYDESISIILISASLDSFGLISYINLNAARMLKMQKADAIGTNFTSLIPKPFSDNHNEIIKNFYLNCSNPTIDVPHNFFLQDHKDHLFECNLLLKFTTFNCVPYVIASFRPINKLRQIILLTEKGIILSFSALIPNLFCIEEQHLKGAVITKFFPGLCMDNFPLFEPRFLKYNGKEIGIVRLVKTIKTTSIHLLLVISEKEELKKWRKGKSEEQIEQLGKIYSVKQKDTSGDSTNSFINFEKINSRFATRFLRSIEKSRGEESFTALSNENNEEVDENRLSSVAAINKTSLIIAMKKSASDHLEKTGNSIKVFIAVLLLSTIAMIALNVGIVSVVYQFMSDTNTMNIFNRFNDLLYLVSLLPDISNDIYYEVKYPGSLNLAIDTQFLNDTINGLDLIQDTLITDLDKWSYCDASWIVSKEIIPLWTFDDLPILQKHNLIRALDLYKKHGYRIVDTLAQSQTYNRDSMRFLWLNSLTFTYDYLNNTLRELSACEKSRVRESGENVRYFILFGMCIFGLCYVILNFFTYLVKIKYELFWGKVKKAVYLTYFTLQQNAAERLMQIHGTEVPEETKFTKIKNGKKYKVDSKIFRRYGWRLLFFVAICLFYYSLALFWLYSSCEASLIARPEILENFIIRRALLAKLWYFSANFTSDSAKILFPDYYAIPSPQKEFPKLISEFKYRYKQLWSPSLFDYLSDELKARLFEWNNHTVPFGNYGDIPAVNLVILESYGMSILNNQDLYSFFVILANGGKQFAEDYTLANRDTKDIINGQLALFIYFTVWFSISLALLFLLYYLPFLWKELKIVKRAQILPLLVPKFIS
ncbi:unnamed protein product [Blepharisma stoltei]|uniref:TmcB/TmcC TPR repeats domain-containing protein n=1 Tax=Blepharisma stoltei TaxID=1481888 RepID=A0AAU9J646_9CILI|nr:unnamed protein product [Blepharisma stoltei]